MGRGQGEAANIFWRWINTPSSYASTAPVHVVLFVSRMFPSFLTQRRPSVRTRSLRAARASIAVLPTASCPARPRLPEATRRADLQKFSSCNLRANSHST